MRSEGHVTHIDPSLELLNPTSGTHEPVGRVDVIHKETVEDPHDLRWWDVLRK